VDVLAGRLWVENEAIWEREVGNDIDVEILKTDQYGVVLKCRDIKTAGKFGKHWL
jgi:hypothetical protein